MIRTTANRLETIKTVREFDKKGHDVATLRVSGDWGDVIVFIVGYSPAVDAIIERAIFRLLTIEPTPESGPQDRKRTIEYLDIQYGIDLTLKMDLDSGKDGVMLLNSDEKPDIHILIDVLSAATQKESQGL